MEFRKAASDIQSGVHTAWRGVDAFEALFRTVPGQVFLVTLAVLIAISAVLLSERFVEEQLHEIGDASMQGTADMVESRVRLATLTVMGPSVRVVLDHVQRRSPQILRIDLVDPSMNIRYSTDRAAEDRPPATIAPEALRLAVLGGQSVALFRGTQRLVARPIAVPRPGQVHPGGGEPWLLLVQGVDVVAQGVRQHMRTAVQLTTGAMLLVALALGAYVHVRLIRPARALGQRMRLLAGATLPEPLLPARYPAELRPIAEGFNRAIEGLRTAREQVAWLDRDRFERLERLVTIGRLSATVAHEIRNPLAGIANAVAVIAREVPMPDEHRGVLEEVQAQARRLSRNLTDFLVSTRPHDPQIVRLDCGLLIERTASLVRPSYRRAGFRIDVRVAPQLPPVLADEEWLVQILVNLTVNAEEALREGGRVRIEAGLVEGSLDRVRIAVQDDGVGMPPEVLARAGEPFFTTKSRGTGLGLSMSRDLAQKMGGTLVIRSNEHDGTTVELVLPAAQEHEA